jgi:MRG-binding protein
MRILQTVWYPARRDFLLKSETSNLKHDHSVAYLDHPPLCERNMPPKKRARVTATAASPTPSTTAPPSAASPAPPSKSTPSEASIKHPGTLPSTSDPWTTAQEIALFKALIRYKPTGMHKHFHMLSVSSFLRSHGHALLPPQTGTLSKQKEEQLVPHTRIAGVWEKLSAIYDLDILNEREDQHALAIARAASQDEDVAGDASPDPEMGEWVHEFTLPEHAGTRPAGSTDGEEDDEAQFAELMWQRRFPGDDEKERSSSPHELLMYRGRDGVVERTSPSPAPTVGTVQSRSSTTGRRGGRTRGAKGTPASVTRANTTASRRSSRFGSEVKSSPAPVGQEDTQMSVDEDEEQEEEDGDDEEVEEEQGKTTKTRARKGRSSTMTRGRGRGRGKKG